MGKESGINYGALWRWARSSPRRMVFLVRMSSRHWLAQRRHRRQVHRIDGSVPSILAVSPTMRCNYNCKGCYSRGRPEDNELSTNELDSLFSDAENLGVHSVVLTGGEPLIRGDMLPLVSGHPGLLFFLITNGSLMTPEIARRMARTSNLVTLVSIEGFASNTDGRRHPGAHDTAMLAIDRLRAARAVYGFVATISAANSAQLATDAFIDRMVEVGCAVGFFTEYVPCGQDPRPEWVLDEIARTVFRERVLEFRRSKPIVLSLFPDDEYGRENRCAGAGRTSLHINSQGGIEPCPFVPVSRDSIRNGGLIAACRSPFLRAIREEPGLLRRDCYACALFEHRTELAAIAGRIDREGGKHP